jgi:hypothetical protein
MTRATINYLGVELECTFWFDPEEPATNDHPGSPANAQLDSCKVRGVELIEIFSGEQIARIETLCAEAMEGIAA